MLIRVLEDLIIGDGIVAQYNPAPPNPVFQVSAGGDPERRYGPSAAAAWEALVAALPGAMSPASPAAIESLSRRLADAERAAAKRCRRAADRADRLERAEGAIRAQAGRIAELEGRIAALQARSPSAGAGRGTDADAPPAGWRRTGQPCDEIERPDGGWTVSRARGGAPHSYRAGPWEAFDPGGRALRESPGSDRWARFATRAEAIAAVEAIVAGDGPEPDGSTDRTDPAAPLACPGCGGTDLDADRDDPSMCHCTGCRCIRRRDELVPADAIGRAPTCRARG